MNLFIDTNIFLSFYHFTSDDLEELKKLGILLEQNKLSLILPQQIVNEFRRNRHNKIADALKRLRDQRFNLQFPQVCKGYDEYETLRDLQRKYTEQHSALIKKITGDIWAESLKADETVRELFTKAKVVETDGHIVNRAQLRVNIGNPPGKSGSLGDAINWEVLLEHIPDGENLYFVTDDKDYFSPLDENKFNAYLLNEWSEMKDANLIFYKRLSAFFKDHFPSISLASELEKELLIQELAASHSFAQTHSVIAELRKYGEFTAAQVNDIVEAAISNNQIYWIISDLDVYEFITAVINNNETIIDENNLEELQELLRQGKVEMIREDEIPF